MKLIQSAVTIAVLSSLAACGGGVGSSEVITAPATAKACDAVLYREITGSYNGRIEYQSPDWIEDKQSCAWDVSMSVSTEDNAGTCAVSFDYQSQSIAGGCADLATTGGIDIGIDLDENKPQWPAELPFRSAEFTDVFSIYAPGNVNVGGWESVFDGRGNASTDQVSELDGWSGVLVRFSDQPFQEDDGSVVSGSHEDE